MQAATIGLLDLRGAGRRRDRAGTRLVAVRYVHGKTWSYLDFVFDSVVLNDEYGVTLGDELSHAISERSCRDKSGKGWQTWLISTSSHYSTRFSIAHSACFAVVDAYLDVVLTEEVVELVGLRMCQVAG